MSDYLFLVSLSKFLGFFLFGTTFIGVVLYVLFKGDELEKNSDIPLRDDHKEK